MYLLFAFYVILQIIFGQSKLVIHLHSALAPYVFFLYI